ncbi:uncharacterized protein LOC133744441 [Rosa rugosa]|uniref:uncharacterized protein LOC133744441 n=1 Tax=Rosa rugosa TaxID=74645 RepID=UPI002B417813|nr:uncharacterized protein LOC133744441 [Rosa rugosa]
MKVLYWNLRGIANDPTQDVLKKFVRDHNPDVLCISEPFVSLDSLPLNFWSSLNLVIVGTNDRGSALPNLWVLCKPSLLHAVTIVSRTDQQISIAVVLDSVNCVLSPVYARTSIEGRRRLWTDLAYIKDNFVSGPWLVFGDFNAILGAHEKKGGAPVCRRSCEEFQAMSDVCELIHVDTHGAEFTWVRRRGLRGNVEERLDRCLANLSWMDSWDTFDCSTLPRLCSDHNPLLMSFSNAFGARQSFFRFRRMWLEHGEFHAFIKQCWDSVSMHGCPLSILQHKLRVLRKALRTWNWEVFGDVHRRVDSDLAELVSIQQIISSTGGSDADFSKESELQANLSESYDPLAIQNHIVEYYSDLFANPADTHDTGLISRVIPSMVTDDENVSLMAFPSSEEILLAIKGMDLDSVPGPDGFNGHFFIACWDVVGTDVTSAVQFFFHHGTLPGSFNSSLIILIPKVDHTDSIKQFRPIALANFVFKIIPKILSIRLASIASRIISPQQHAFVPGRNITDCIVTTSECINLLDSKCHGGNVAIKLDITKAFYTLSWDFLVRVLEAFGFNPIFVNWVRALLSSAKLSLLVNGRSVGYFSCGRGVRQGDPLSPLLFCLAEEVLSRGLSMLLNSGRFHPISSPRGVLAPSHVLFADDVIVFCRGDQRSLHVVMSFLEEYGHNSGQLLNKAKSHVFLSKHIHYRRHSIATSLGIPIGQVPFSYLGVPIFRGKPRASYFQPIVDRIRVRLSSWTGSLLSMAGRLQLLKSVFHSMLVYSFQVYEWPVSLLRRLEVWCRNFLWSGSIDKRGVPLVSWRTCCTSLEEGGLGLKQLVVLNHSLILKKSWEVFSSTSTGCSFLRARFWRNGVLRRSYACSSIWPGVKRFWAQVQENTRWIIGSGRSVSFWHDNFMGKPLMDFFGSHTCMFALKDDLVADYIHNGAWNFPSLLQFHFPGICKLIDNVPISLVPDMPDKLIWVPSSSGELTAKEAFHFLRPRLPLRDWGKLIWSKFIIPRISLHSWKVLRGRVLSEDLLQRRGIALASRCVLYGLAVRNKMRHDDGTIVVDAARQLIMGHLKASSKLASGCMSNSLTELRGWIKINTDGAWQSVSRRAGFGGVFRDFHGSFLGAFASNLDIPSSVDAEVMAVIQAIELAWVREWKHIWLEVDSTLVLNFL